METHSSILAWRIPMDRRAWRATVREVTERVGHDPATEHSTVIRSTADLILLVLKQLLVLK